MDWLNYHHLFYFHTVVEEGGVAAASRRLHVGRPSISVQIKSLEAFLGTPLFERRGKRLELTETGRMVHGYSTEIFRTGRELLDQVRGREPGRPRVFRVGIADVMPKVVAFQLLLPALEADEELRLVCREDDSEHLVAALALHELDLVLSDVPLRPGIDVRAYGHVVGRSPVGIFATPKVARRLRGRFPASLEGEPILLPAPGSALRRPIEAWFDEHDVHPRLVAEFDDSALMKVFGGAGRGVFPAPTVVADGIAERYGVRLVGELEGLTETFYAISPERRVKHPAVVRLIDEAKRDLFA